MGLERCHELGREWHQVSRDSAHGNLVKNRQQENGLVRCGASGFVGIAVKRTKSLQICCERFLRHGFSVPSHGTLDL